MPFKWHLLFYCLDRIRLGQTLTQDKLCYRHCLTNIIAKFARKHLRPELLLFEVVVISLFFEIFFW